MKKLTILGSTGSIGVSTLEVVAAHPDAFQVVALTGGNNLELLKTQIESFGPEMVSVLTAEKARALSRMLTGKKPVEDVVPPGQPAPKLTFASGRLAISLLIASAAIVYFIVRAGG